MDTIPRTAAREARGKYLVKGLLWCEFCHSEYDFTKRPAYAKPGTEGGGHDFEGYDFGLPPGNHIVAPNISPDPESGGGKWKDADFVRAIRQGIGHDGRTLFPIMPYFELRGLSDEDLASVVIYLRSIPPVHKSEPKTVITPELSKQVRPLPPIEHVAEPEKSDRIGYGQYLVRAARCEFCHTPQDDHGESISGLAFAGGFTFAGPYSPNGRTVTVASLNLTPDPSGIPYFDEAMFIKAVRSGRVGARPLTTVMPWSIFRNLTDDDLKAIFAYLRTVPPVKHRVDNTEPPTYCRLCRHKHGYGNMN